MPRFPNPIYAMCLAAGLLLIAPQAALAVPGATLEQSIKLARTQKKDVMGVVYYVQKGRVYGETWNSQISSWNDKKADQLRALIVGKKAKLKKREEKNPATTMFYYDNGVTVRYNRRPGRILTLDVAASGYRPDNQRVGKYEEIADWQEAPYKGKSW